jgi:hypothetical protein
MRSLLAALLLMATADGTEFEVPPALQKLIDGGKWDAGTPGSFRIIVLSNLADACAGQAHAKPGTEKAARTCIDGALKKALSLGKSEDGLTLTHLNLIYGAADEVGPCADPVAHERVSRELARRSLSDPTRHAASYQGVSLRWPADQAATLASLARFDGAHHTTLLEAPLLQWESFLAMHLDAKTALPVSEVTGKGPGAKYPRGCAQSYLTRYLAEADPALAATWWAQYRDHFLVHLGPVVGFREWPQGVERKGDVDSGPIILGIGTAASAFALPASKAQGDVLLAAQLEGSAGAVMATGAGGAVAQTVLAQAIRFEGRWQPAHSVQLKERSTPRPTP